MREVRIVQGLGGPVRGLGHALDELGAEPLSHEEGRRVGSRPGLGGDRAEGDRGFLDRVTFHPERHRDAQHREVEGAAPAQLEIGGAPAFRGRQHDVRQDLAGLLAQILDAVVLVEGADGNDALPLGADQPDLRAQAPEHGRRVGRGHRPAAVAAGGDEADLPVLLHAEVDGLPPLVGLVVVVAARVDAHVAADRAHVAELRARDQPRRRGESWIAPRDLGMLRHGGQDGPRADGHPRVGRAPRADQVAYAAETNQHGGLELAALHVRIEISAARHQHGLGPVVGYELDRIRHRDGGQVCERRQSHHFPKGLTEMSSAGWPKADSTARGSGNVKSGSFSGPTRGVLPCRFSSRALSTLSGVMGISSIRIPTASNTALFTAGITGRGGPRPASLAPNGPSGASPSPRMVWISGVSRVVGLLYSSIEGALCTPFLKTCSSIRTSPRPMYTEPSTWPSTRSGLRARPMSWAIQISVGLTWPVSASTWTSTTQAEYE